MNLKEFENHENYAEYFSELTGLPQLITAEQVAEIVPLSTERILDLAESGYMPHIELDGIVCFQKNKVKTWIKRNLVVVREGRCFPEMKIIKNNKADPIDRPGPLKQLQDLQELPLPVTGNTSGVYFLCLADKIMYVGQSTQLVSRIGSHLTERSKDFDRVFFIFVPKCELNEVEAEFIHSLQPPYNNNKENHQ